jgi:XrtN system VIT domain protein
MTLKVLSSNLRYDNLQHFGRWSNNLSSTITEEVRHDPLVIIAQLILGEFPFDDETCLKIIEYQYDARHEVYRKLWSGKDLETKQVISDIQVFPDYRLAYVEKTITIANNNPSNWSQQEALYTFKLPEGSVASSLSLWIDGKEEKSRLTTKSKADSAYTSIVGYEMRDPALLHWQEGNTITVTIFPCTPAEERIFKIGLTAPLKIVDNQLVLDNITFKGPNFLWTDEISTIEFLSKQQLDISTPSEFDQIDKNKYIYKGTYDENKIISLKVTPLLSNVFSFNNKNYRIVPNEKQNVKFNPTIIYLDVNKSWSKNEFEKILEIYQNKQIYVFDNQLIQLNQDNKDELFDRLGDLNFSLFPLHEIRDTKSSLLISKATKNSPNLSDLKSTKFGNELSDYLSNTTAKIKLANIGNELSPYLRSLKEFEVFDYWSGNAEELAELSNKQIFSVNLIADNEVAIECAKSKIVMENQATVSNAPDHLMRLFAYNQIMKITGRNYFNNNSEFQQSLIDIANEAYVVLPISSLVVLETVKDYERFDIQENENSLQNAVKNSSGSVPEPHEWALIILSLLVVTYLYFKKS